MACADRQIPRQSDLSAFLALTFGCTWLLWALASPLIQQRLGVRLSGDLLVALGTAVPSLAALGLSAWRGVARELLEGLLRWRVHAGWYAFALLGPPILMLVAMAIHVALGGAWPDYPAASRWPLFAINFVAVLLVGGPLGEELGWRGYALPRLSARVGLPCAGALLGIVWAAWHIPLFLLPFSAQAGVPFLWFALQAVSLSIILAVAWQLTGRSLLLPVLLHASVNAFAVPLRVLPEDVASTRPYILTVALTWGCALILLWSLGCKQRRQLRAPLRERPAKQLRKRPL